MSESSEEMSLVERWWPLLVILFGIIFLSVLMSFKPGEQRDAKGPSPSGGSPIHATP